MGKVVKTGSKKLSGFIWHSSMLVFPNYKTLEAVLKSIAADDIVFYSSLNFYILYLNVASYTLRLLHRNRAKSSDRYSCADKIRRVELNQETARIN